MLWSMQETQQSNLSIYFGRNDDLMVEIKDITIFVYTIDHGVHQWKCRDLWEQKGYKRVRVFVSCEGLHIVGEGNPDGEMFVPSTSISRFVIDHLPGHKFDKP